MRACVLPCSKWRYVVSVPYDTARFKPATWGNHTGADEQLYEYEADPHERVNLLVRARPCLGFYYFNVHLFLGSKRAHRVVYKFERGILPVADR